MLSHNFFLVHLVLETDEQKIWFHITNTDASDQRTV